MSYVIVVDAFSSGNQLAPILHKHDFEVIHVFSMTDVSSALMATYYEEHFIKEYIYGGDVKSFVANIRGEYPEIKAIFAGTETAIDLVDEMAEELNVPGNNPVSSKSRFNKYHMIETLRSANVAVTEQIKSNCAEEIISWKKQCGFSKIVLKPLESAGSDCVFACSTREEVCSAFTQIIGSENQMGKHNTLVLAQNYLDGEEYYVNAVSCDGEHFICEVWRYHKCSLHGRDFVYDYNEYIPLDEKNNDVVVLRRYMLEVLKALDFRYGPSHAEIKLTTQGPKLIEIGARLQGMAAFGINKRTMGFTPAELTVDSYLFPEQFAAKTQNIKFEHFYARRVFVRSYIYGKLERINYDGEIENLESCIYLRWIKSVGDILKPTIDYFSIPAIVVLAHTNEEQVKRDYEYIREFEKGNLFTTQGVDGCGLLLSSEERQYAWQLLGQKLEDYIRSVDHLRVPQNTNREEVLQILSDIDFRKQVAVEDIIEWTHKHMKKTLLQIASPNYYGVFNPQASSMSLIADAFVAVYNPQLASTASAMLCIEIENYLVKYFAQKFGLCSNVTKGCFTSGATEANFMSLLCALSEKIPSYRDNGLRSVDKWPVVYTSAETHGSIKRSCRISGIGTDSLRVIPIKENLQMDLQKLEEQILADKKNGLQPLMVVANLGSTSSGTIDAIEKISAIAKKYKLWFHLDAAWGGAALMIEEFSYLRSQIAEVDSVSFDPHKWLSVAIGCGMFFVKRGHLLRQSFSIEAVYMPDETQMHETTEPYRDTLQWSRRFMGLKLFLTLLAHGEQGYCDVLQHQIQIGNYLKEQLKTHSWKVVNDTPWPVACFVDNKYNQEATKILSVVNGTGEVWITNTKLMWKKQSVLRVGISNFRTQKSNIDKLIQVLNRARQLLAKPEKP